MENTKRNGIYLIMIIGLFILSHSCKDDEKTVPVLNTAAVSNITRTTASCGGDITGGCSKVSERGVCWSVNANPTIADSKAYNGTGVGSYTCTLTALDSNTTYFVRAFATNCVGTGYGNSISFTTQQ